MFEATVKTCRDGCQPAYCNGLAGRSEPSFGRRKRSVNDTEVAEGDLEMAATNVEENVIKANGKLKLFNNVKESFANYFDTPK